MGQWRGRERASERRNDFGESEKESSESVKRKLLSPREAVLK